ncbi:hypothetical protein GPUN_0838 [Glaciecola punicea ACAM 611]|uniref:Uncharacterized protein n=1 Tax=Glaciecola punicea ACAM 611 TaxID=1121923 RepID=H5T9J6_9ALTE|nr:hypothetical protein GPUN_0838 [Glaciecola punicea ACAM 611]
MTPLSAIERQIATFKKLRIKPNKIIKKQKGKGISQMLINFLRMNPTSIFYLY